MGKAEWGGTPICWWFGLYFCFVCCLDEASCTGCSWWLGDAGSCIRVVSFVWVLSVWYSLVLESVLLFQRLRAWSPGRMFPVEQPQKLQAQHLEVGLGRLVGDSWSLSPGLAQSSDMALGASGQLGLGCFPGLQGSRAPGRKGTGMLHMQEEIRTPPGCLRH